MAFRFKLKEPTQGGLRRIGLEQIERAEAQLTAAGDKVRAIHETRKGLKRIRALLRLVRPGLGDEVFRTENARFRSIAAALAPARDSVILAETVAKLESLTGLVSNAALAAVKKIIAEDTSDARSTEDSDIKSALVKLGAAKRRFRKLALEPPEISTLERGLATGYRRGKRAFAAAYAEESDEGFHEWRKCVQQHWRHMALMSRAWPAHFDARVQAARSLSQILGEDHDLSVLVDFVRGLPPQRLPAKLALEIERLARGRQAELRNAAEPRGRQLYAEGAKGHGRRIGRLWKAAQDIDREHKDDKPVSGDAAAAPSEAMAARN
jgi:CHAD domain-containing protein